MRYSLTSDECKNLAISREKEFLLTNGLGGFAMGTPSGINTRRYHGLLVAATHPPAGRHVLLPSIEVEVSSDRTGSVCLGANQYPGTVFPDGYRYLESFAVGDSAVWNYKVGDIYLEKELRLLPGCNTAVLIFRNKGRKSLVLNLKPLVSHKFYHSNFQENGSYPQHLLFQSERTVIEHESIPLIIDHVGAERTPLQGWYYRFEHEREAERGLHSRDDLFCPCELLYSLAPGAIVTLTIGTSDPLTKKPANDVDEAEDLRTKLVKAVEKFIVETPSRTSIIAGYPWFTDWGRDTMISLPGVLLCTGRIAEARKLLVDYSACIQDGLIPNRFSEIGGADYNTVDGTLWFVNAVYKTLQKEWEPAFAVTMMQALKEIFTNHKMGTRFGIGVDPNDGLLTQGEEGLQLTWMDAKLGDWVVTPRHGKPVEINGLWVNALRVMEWVATRLGSDAIEFSSAAEQAEESFDRKFWHEGRGHYADTVDPLDLSLRPNQVIAMALPFSPMDASHARQALSRVAEELLTPFGLRTLAPGEPGYCGRFSGKLSELDAAYHRGTVWPWLMGSYVTAIAKFEGDVKGGRALLKNAEMMLAHRGLGGIAEVYDGDEPHYPGGCPWQAWSAAEYLRAWDEDVQAE